MMKVITIGRSSENDVVIPDVRVSRTHLQIVRNDRGVCSVVDLNSVNGTYVNGQRIVGEVCLQPTDEIRIGNTILPWQTYFNFSPVGPGGNSGGPVLPPPQRPNRKGLYLAIAVVAVVLAGGGFGFYVYHNAEERRKIEAENQKQEDRIERLRQEAEQKSENVERLRNEAERLQAEADSLFRKALISQNDKSKELAAAKQKEADEAKREAEAAQAALRQAEIARIAAENGKREADQATKTVLRDSEKAIRNVEEKANQAISEAKTERDSANQKAELIEKFYEAYAGMKPDFAKQVCKQLNLDLSKDKGEAKMLLKEAFNGADNRGKQAILDAIRVVKRQNSKTEKIAETEADSMIAADLPLDQPPVGSDE